MAGPQYEIGKYWGRITSQWLSEAKTGTPQFCVRFLVVGKINLADPEGDLITCQQAERTVYRPITDNTIEYVKKDLELLGFSGSSFKLLDPNTPGYQDFTGKELAFYCSHQPGQGNVGLREQWGFASTDAPAAKPLDAKKLRDLDNLFGKHLKGIKKRAAPPSEPTQDEIEEANRSLPDEVPF